MGVFVLHYNRQQNNEQRARSRYYTKEDSRRANKHKEILTSSVIREINIKTTKDITAHLSGRLNFKKKKTVPYHVLVRIQRN